MAKTGGLIPAARHEFSADHYAGWWLDNVYAVVVPGSVFYTDLSTLVSIKTHIWLHHVESGLTIQGYLTEITVTPSAILFSTNDTSKD